MSQADDSEDDIWEYKPLSKKKKSHESFPATASTSKETFKKHFCPPTKSSARDVKLTESYGSINNGRVPDTSGHNPGSFNKGHVPDTSVHNPGSINKGHVPDTSGHNPGSINKGHIPDTSLHNPGSINKGHVPDTSGHNPGSINKGHVPDTSVYNPGSIGKVRVPDTSVTNPGSITKGYTPEMNSGQSGQEAYTESHTLCSQSPEPTGDGATESDFCPICQMPFSILMSQSQMGHVAACLDTTRDDALECPDGLQCSSNIQIHYERYNHTLLAHNRAAHESVLISLSRSCRTTGGSGSHSPSLPESSQGSPAFSSSLPNPRRHLASTPTRLTSSLSNHNASPVGGHLAPTPTQTKNSLLLLRSPRLEDFKKKKGWMTPREPKTKGAGRKTNPTVSSRPGDADRKPGSQGAAKRPDQPEPPPFDYDSISFSPLSELPAELESEEEVAVSGCKKALFPPSVTEKNREGESEDSLELFSDNEFLNDFVERLESDPVPEHAAEPASLPGCSTQLEAVGSFGAPSNQPAGAAAVDSTPSATRRAAGGRLAADTAQSPQSIVLERLRQTLTGPNGFSCQSVSSSNNHHDDDNKTPGSSLTASPTSAQAMAPRKPALSQCKAGQGPSLKQTDIGVFFGLKPLKDPQGEPGSTSQSLTAATDAAAAYPGGGSQRGGTRGRWPRGERGARKRGTGPAGAGLAGSQAAAAGTSSTDGGGPSAGPAGAPGEGPRGGRRTGRARWNRGGVDSDGTRRCPFYKKIPGTGFAVDAFSYGLIEGISSYFLTHFHSDHYGGLTRKSTVPIYCNKITGNLVRSKLKVEEQYLHILPMNTRVVVERVEVILMEANHCPGAAMLLFFLPDGQIVLHTGDFRADPTMESYPELLSCRVQTLYLDTTYCSPEYTFPRQQEAIRFASNTAFELVALHPRTLVVCGSYSVGKEKVFLALAEVLGSKVCLSRDKYNTMCCLESEPIRKQLTTDWKAAQVHVLPMMQLTVKKLQDHLSRFSALYDRLVAFKPTGWTFSQQMDSVDDIQPQISGSITVYGVPYSEHSSFLEMKRFVQWLRPLKIIPTVNAGSWATRQAMEKCFREWLAEGGANR